MNEITIVMAYFNQPEIMLEWWDNLRAYEDEVAEHVRIAICDDGSQKHPLVIPEDIRTIFKAVQFRLNGDVPWREMVARNLCMKNSAGWCFMTDPDYMLDPGMMKRLVNKQLERNNYYHLSSRLYSNKKPLHMPENMAVIHTGEFWAAGGYDETFAGGYGFSDCMLFKCLKDGTPSRNNLVTDILMDHYPKGSYHSLHEKRTFTDAASPAKRDTTKNKLIFEGVLNVIRRNGIKIYIQSKKTRVSQFGFEVVL